MLFPVSVALLAVALPCLRLRLIGPESLARIRDWMLLSLVGLAGVGLALHGNPFAPLCIFFLWWWRSRRVLPSLTVWAGLCGYWLALEALPGAYWPWVGAGWVVVAVAEVAWLAGGWVWVGRHLATVAADVPLGLGLTPHQITGGRPWWHPYRPLHLAAWFGQRTYAAAFCALTLPFFPGWTKVIPVVGLFLTSSWTAWLASWAAAGVLWPSPWLWGSGPVLVLGAAVVNHVWPDALNLTPRGGSLDPVWQRLKVWRAVGPTLLMREWWPWGYGPRSMEKGVARLAVVKNVLLISPLHADVLHFLFEYGLPGVASLVWLGVLVIPHLQWEDPWSAAWVAGVVCAVGGSPFRLVNLGSVWLAVNVKLAGGL
jgi:hypothetical protein